MARYSPHPSYCAHKLYSPKPLNTNSVSSSKQWNWVMNMLVTFLIPMNKYMASN